MVRLEPTLLLFLVCISIQYSSCKDVGDATAWKIQFDEESFLFKNFTLILKGTNSIAEYKAPFPNDSIIPTIFRFTTVDIGLLQKIEPQRSHSDVQFGIKIIARTSDIIAVCWQLQEDSLEYPCNCNRIPSTTYDTSEPSSDLQITMPMSTTPKRESPTTVPTTAPTTASTTAPTTAPTTATTTATTTTPTMLLTNDLTKINKSSIQQRTTPMTRTTSVESPTMALTTLLMSTMSPVAQMRATCYPGWINVKGLCYRIINKKTGSHEASINCDGDSILATRIPEELRESFGYNETVWLNKCESLQACNMGDPSTCTTSGKYNSLCSREMLNDSITLSGPARFFDALSWMIPNTKKSLEIIKERYPKCCSPDGMWIGLYKSNKKLFWMDNSSVSEIEKAFLNISDSLSDGDCAMYNGSISFTSCSSRKRGLRTPLLSVPCSRPRPQQRISAEEFEDILKELTVDKRKTSKYKRSKTTAPDERTSSKIIGVVAALTVGIPLTAIIMTDLPILTFQIMKMYENIGEIFQ